VLIVDYGVKQVKMRYSIAQGSNWLAADRWCAKQFKFGEYHRCNGYFHFAKQKHLVWFVLKWS